MEEDTLRYYDGYCSDSALEEIYILDEDTDFVSYLYLFEDRGEVHTSLQIEENDFDYSLDEIICASDL